MIDPQNREVTHLRISLTQNCNLNCMYCHREGQENSDKELTVGVIKKMVEEFAELGIKRVKLTGGESLLREDILDIVRVIASTPGIEELSMTTNGYLLPKLALPLKQAGLNRVNIGCDSLTSILPKNMRSVLPGIEAARKVELTPIKLNMVVLKGINDHEIGDMIEFAKQQKIILQLIELISLNQEKGFYQKHYYSLDKIERELERKAKRINIRKMQARKQYNLGDVIIEVTRPNHKIFCQNCNKIRVTSDGKIKPCLMRKDNLVDYKDKGSILEALNRRSIFYG